METAREGNGDVICIRGGLTLVVTGAPHELTPFIAHMRAMSATTSRTGRDSGPEHLADVTAVVLKIQNFGIEQDSLLVEGFEWKLVVAEGAIPGLD